MSTARDQIIQATCELLELQGYHATGLNQIIKESGSPKGSLYYYFPGGKQELVAESVQRVGTIVLNRIRQNLAVEATADEAIRAFIVNIAVNVELSGYHAGGPITTVALEVASTNEHLRAVCQQIYAEWQAAFSDRLVADGVGEGRARSLALVIIAALEGGIILCRTQRSREPLEQLAEEMERLVKSALAA